MVNKIAEIVTGEQVVAWLIICFLVAYFVYKEWPEFQQRASSRILNNHKQAVARKSVEGRLTSIEGRLNGMDEKLARDYERINGLEKEKVRTRRVLEESLEEREIIMRALLGALGGLQELGADGVTKSAEAEINNYLNRKAHSTETSVD